jgi:LysM repeat protein
MANPFNGIDKQAENAMLGRRERLKVGFYTALGATAVFLSTMLIQGCKREQQQSGYEPLDTNVVDTVSRTTALTPPEPATAPVTGTNLTSLVPETASTGTMAAAPSIPEPATNATVTTTEPKADRAKAAGPTTYVVKRGDTLTRIAKTHGTTVKAIREANNLRTDQLHVGRKLKIPAAKS